MTISLDSPRMLVTIPKESTAAAVSDEACCKGTVHVLHIHRKPFAGQFSIENLFANLRKAMQRPDYRVERFVVPYHSKGFIRRLLSGWSACRRPADVYHITGDIHYVAMFLPGQKTILTIHDCGALERPNGIRRWLLKMFWFDLPTRRAEYVTVISEECKRQLQRLTRISDEKVFVIPDAVSQIYRPCLREFNLTCPRILHIGSTINKNLPRLVQALSGMGCHLHIIGHLSGSQLQELQASGIDFSTACDLSEEQMYESYCEADVVSFVSTYEGFGLPILEANAVGRPVVASNLSSMPEVAGDAACLVDPYNVASIRAGICRVVEDADYRKQLVLNGFRNRKRFSPEEVASKYLDLYRRLYAERQYSQRKSPCVVSQG